MYRREEENDGLIVDAAEATGAAFSRLLVWLRNMFTPPKEEMKPKGTEV